MLKELQARNLADTGKERAPYDAEEASRRKAEDRKREAARLKSAHDLFAAGVSCAGSPAQTYLEGRGIVGLHFNRVARTLRFHPSVLHGASGQRLPAMLAQIRGPKGQPLGLHRTFLKPDGSGKADVEPQKMMLGPSSGGAVWTCA